DPEKIDVPRLIKDRGLKLAEAIADMVADSELGKLFNAGECPDTADLDPLAEFGLLVDVSHIPDEEIALLRDAILPVEPRRKELPRIGTYAALLARAKSLGKAINPDDIFAAAADPDYNPHQVLQGTLDGWLIYLCRDMLAFTHEVVFEKV